MGLIWPGARATMAFRRVVFSASGEAGAPTRSACDAVAARQRNPGSPYVFSVAFWRRRSGAWRQQDARLSASCAAADVAGVAAGSDGLRLLTLRPALRLRW